MQFTLRTLLVFFVFAASAMGLMGGWGLPVALWLAAVMECCRRGYHGWTALLFAAPLVAAFLLLPAVSTVRGPARRAACTNNMGQLALALHAYHADHGRFPPAYVADAAGRPMHSWRVLILPYLGRGDLYDEYDFSQPWDSPANRRIGELPLRTFQCPSDPSPAGTTSYLAVVGPETAWPAPDSAQLDDFRDGPSQTLLLVEVAQSGVHWTEPRDLTLAEALEGVNVSRRRGIRGNHFDWAVAVWADGNLRSLPAGLDRDVLRGLLTRSGGEVIDTENLRAYASPPPPPPRFWQSQEFRTGCALVVFVASGIVLFVKARRPRVG